MWSAETYIAKIHFCSRTEKNKSKIYFLLQRDKKPETFSLQSLKPIRCFFKHADLSLVRLGHVTTLRSNSINSAGFLKSPLSISLYLLRFARHWCVKLISLSLAEVGRVTLYKTWTQVERCHEADSLKKKTRGNLRLIVQWSFTSWFSDWMMSHLQELCRLKSEANRRDCL